MSQFFLLEFIPIEFIQAVLIIRPVMISYSKRLTLSNEVYLNIMLQV